MYIFIFFIRYSYPIYISIYVYKLYIYTHNTLKHIVLGGTGKGCRVKGLGLVGSDLVQGLQGLEGVLKRPIEILSPEDPSIKALIPQAFEHWTAVFMHSLENHGQSKSAATIRRPISPPVYLSIDRSIHLSPCYRRLSLRI